tara:strand:- start:11632 stop:12636 length:1005 start_codon:yes stop_codon:yes gene_type:complete
MALGIGLSTTKYQAFPPYEMTGSVQYDGNDDFAGLGVNGDVPADGTIKMLHGGLTVAAWFKLDVSTSSGGPYNATTNHMIVSCAANGGWFLQFTNKRVQFGVKLTDGAGNFSAINPTTEFAMGREPTSATDFKRYLYRSDGWHLAVGTWDGNRIKQIFLDGGRSVAGDKNGTSSTNFGSAPEITSTSTGTDKSHTTAPSPSGNNALGENKWFVKYDEVNLNSHRVDVLIGASPRFNIGTGLTTNIGSEFEGFVGDVAIWDKALTDTQINTIYNNHRPMDMSIIESANLRGYWKANDAAGTSIAATVGNNATLSNGPTITTITPSLDVTGLGGNY